MVLRNGFTSSCRLTKFNKNNWAQERIFVLTDQNIMNLKRKALKRRIALEQMAGVTQSHSSG